MNEEDLDNSSNKIKKVKMIKKGYENRRLSKFLKFIINLCIFSFAIHVIIKLNSKFGIFEDIGLVTQISLFIEHDYIFEALLILVSIIYTYKQCSLIHRGYLKAKLFIISELFISIIYVVYRLFPHCINTKFIGFSFLSYLYYLDTLFLVFLANSAHLLFLIGIRRTKIKSWITKAKLDNDLLSYPYSDTPISKSQDDELNRELYVKLVTDKIRGVSLDISYSMGIIAKWGEGKTSFINLLKEQLGKEKNQYIIIDFNAWKSSNIPVYFFNTLANKLQPYAGGINLVIHSYLRTLQSFDRTNVLKLILDFRDLRLNHQSEFDLIEKAIEKTGKKIIIFIDDIDRLYGDEIISVLKLIRNTANFKNTVFVSAYDKGYLNTAIKKSVSEHNYQEFAEKIFDEEIVLPRINIHSVNYFINQELSRLSSEADLSSFIDVVEEMQYYDDKILKIINRLFITNFRDAKRFLNLFIPIFKKLKDELVFSDLFIIQAIYFKYKSLYILIRNKAFLEIKGEKYTITEDKLNALLKKDIPEYEEELSKIITYLFRSAKPNSISNERYFEDYFQHEVLTRPLKSEIREILNSSADSQSAYNDLIGKISNIEDIINSLEDFYHMGGIDNNEHLKKYMIVFLSISEKSNFYKYELFYVYFMEKEKSDILVKKYYDDKDSEYIKLLKSLLSKM